MINYTALKERVTTVLATELSDTPGYSSAKLEVKVVGAIEEVIMRRSYENSSYSEAQISKDLDRYFAVIVNVARYDYNQIGAEGQESHSDPTARRKWVDRDKMFRGVTAFCKLI